MHLSEDDRKTRKFADGARVLLEDQLPAVLEAIEAATTRALHWAEQRRLREEAEHARRLEAQRIRALRVQYEVWEAQLNERTDAWARHRQMLEFVGVIETDGDDSVRNFVEWARGFLSATDPRARFTQTAPPEWSHEQRVAAGRLQPQPQFTWSNHPVIASQPCPGPRAHLRWSTGRSAHGPLAARR